jgi:sugar lactone lactonase YvrE
MHTAKLQFYRTPPGPVALLPGGYNPDVERRDAGADPIFIDNLKLIKLADGFRAASKPAWDKKESLLFSDSAASETYHYLPANVCSVPIAAQPRVRTSLVLAGHEGRAAALAFDPRGRLTIADGFRIYRIETDGSATTLAEESANEIVYRSDGTLYFSTADRIFSLHNGALASVQQGDARGLALAPDSNALYVTARDRVYRYDVQADGALADPHMIAEVPSAGGIQTDREGNLYIISAEGLRILSSGGKHLGTIVTGRKPRHLAWGDADARTLYLTSQEALYCLRLGIAGFQ